uniref:Uncharacterized protein n=1 Tax=Rhizophora mucronata TaxID=61149 RepID=A0A2P2K976_RHIMU
MSMLFLCFTCQDPRSSCWLTTKRGRKWKILLTETT